MSGIETYVASFDTAPGYLNWAAFGPLSPAVRAEGIEDAEILGGRRGSVGTIFERVKSVDPLLAELLGVTVDDVTLQPSTGFGLQQAVYGVRGGGVLAARHEFPSITVPIQRAADAFGRIQPRIFDAPGGIVTPDAIRDVLTDDVTALVVSLVDFRTGYRADLTALRDVLGPDRLLIVDAVQAFGVLEADYGAADVVAGNGYKWLRAGRASGFASFTPTARERLDPVLSGAAGVDGGLVLDEIPGPAPTAAAFTISPADFQGAARLATALREIRAAGVAEIEARIRVNADEVFTIAEEHGIPVITPRDPERRSGIVTLAPGTAEAEALEAILDEAGVSVTGRSGTVRVAVHAGTTAETLAMLSDALGTFARSRRV